MKYSLIIPVYNAEKNIEQCVSSIIGQDFLDYELILVDDGSTDSSYSICKDLASKCERVRVLHKENGGVSSARNLGIKHAQGEFILFVDSDDYVDKKYFEVIDANVKSGYITVFNNYFDILKKSGERVIQSKNSQKCDNNKEDAFHDLFMKTFYAAPWNKVFEREIIQKYKIEFDEGCVCYEDLIFNLEYMKYIKKVKIIDESLYYYRTNETELHFLKRKWGKPFEVSKKLVNKIKELCKIERYKAMESELNLYSYTAFITELSFLKNTDKDYKENLNKIIKDDCFKYMLFSVRKTGKKLFVIYLLSLFRLYRLEAYVFGGMIR